MWRSISRFARSLHGWRFTFVVSRTATLGVLALALTTFLAANLQALLWSSSDWLVSTVLPGTIVELTNRERPSGAPMLTRSSVLDQAATRKAEHMAEHGYFSHFAPDGTSPWYFFREAGYQYQHAGENLAVFFNDSQAVVAAWMNSPTHRENIVNESFTQIGVGTARGTYQGHDTVFVVQLFGTPATAAGVADEGSPREGVAVAAAPTPAATAPAGAQSATPVPPEGGAEPPAETAPQAAGARDPEPASAQAAQLAALPPPPELDRAPRLVSAPRSTPPELTAAPPPLSAQTVTMPAAADPLPGPFARAATQPSHVLSVVYGTIAFFLLGALVLAGVVALRERRYYPALIQASLGLLLIGLWYVHTTLVAGALVL